MYRVYLNDKFFFGTGIYSRPHYDIVEPVIEYGRNAIGSFNFTVYRGHPLFNNIKELKSYMEVKKEDKTIFRGRVLTIQSGFYNEKNVVCESCFGYLLDSVQRPFNFTGNYNRKSPEAIFRYFIVEHNTQMALHSNTTLLPDMIKQFKPGVVTVASTESDGLFTCAESDYLSTWECLQEKLVSELGGFFNLRYEEDGNYIDYFPSSINTKYSTITFGKNLIDIKKTENSDEIATIIIPIGGEFNGKKVTIADLPMDTISPDICKKDDYVYSKKGIEKYGRIVKIVEFEDEVNPLFLKSAAEKYLASSLDTIESIELTAADLSAVNADIKSFEIGQSVVVASIPHGISSREFEITKLEINLMQPSQNRLVLGSEVEKISSQRSSGSVTVKGSFYGTNALEEAKKYTDSQVVGLGKSIHDGDERLQTEINSVNSDLTAHKQNCTEQLNAQADQIADKANKVHTHTKSEITDFPQSLPASDVSAWAKAATKPKYTASEVGALPSSTKYAASTEKGGAATMAVGDKNGNDISETYYRKRGGTIGGNTELTQTVVHNQNTIPLIIRRGNTGYGSLGVRAEIGDGSAEGTKTLGYLQWGAEGNFSVRNSSNESMLTITTGGRLVVNNIKTKSGLLLADVSNTNSSEPLTVEIAGLTDKFTSLKVDAVLSNTDGNTHQASFILPVGYVAEGNTYMHSCRGYATKTVFFDSCIYCTLSGAALSFKQLVPGGGYVSSVKIFSL